MLGCCNECDNFVGDFMNPPVEEDFSDEDIIREVVLRGGDVKMVARVYCIDEKDVRKILSKREVDNG